MHVAVCQACLLLLSLYVQCVVVIVIVVSSVRPSVPRNSGSFAGLGLGLEDVHGAHHVLPADGALVHAFATLGAGDHVAAFQQHTVYERIHADTTQVLIHSTQLRPCHPIWRERRGGG